jgi:hypothetical protein
MLVMYGEGSERLTLEDPWRPPEVDQALPDLGRVDVTALTPMRRRHAI